MTLALTYEASRARVVASGVAPGLRDDFQGRVVANSWGVSSSGHSWTSTGTATDFSVGGGLGSHSVGVVNSSRWSTAVSGTSYWDYSASVSTDRLASGGSIFEALVGRWVDADNTYLARLEFTTAQAVVLSIRKRVAGVESAIGSGFTTGLTHVANTRYAIRFRGTPNPAGGMDLSAKAWIPATDLEPATWQVTQTDSSLAAPGEIGARSILASTYSGTLPVIAAWDNFQALGLLTIERSLDGVRWSTVRGAVVLDGDAGSQYTVRDYEFASDVVNNYRLRVYDPDTLTTLLQESSSITPSLGGQIWFKLIRFPILSRPIDCANIGDIQRPARLGVFPILGRLLPIGISDFRGSRRFPLIVVTEGLDDTDEFDHAVQAGGVWFIHAPPEQDIECDRVSAIPSTYVEIEANTIQRRIGAGGNKWSWELPCVEVAAPSADVVGTGLTWTSVVALWDTWTQEVADNASWFDLLLVEAPPDSLLGG